MNAPPPAPPISTDAALGERLHALVRDLLPLRRSLTGDGLRATLARLNDIAPVEVTEVPSGTRVGDWTVPDEWRVREAFVARPDGRRVVDWADGALHLVQHSVPVRATMTLAELRPHLHTLPAQPTLVPYRTAYYAPAWGFCLAQDAHDALAAAVGEDGRLDVVIDADLAPGAMSVGECVVPATAGDATGREILLSAHACHPAMANDNASALAVAATLAAAWAERPRRHTLRVLFAPGTLGAIAWLDANRHHLDRIAAGYVLANLGDSGGLTYKQSRPGTLDAPTLADRAVEIAARDAGVRLAVRPFAPTGYDERQFGSPGAHLPVGRLTRTPHGEYPEYHTSADDAGFVTPEALAESTRVLLAALEILDGDGCYQNRTPSGGLRLGEPMLGRHGLYAATGGHAHAPEAQEALLWVLNLADGRHALVDAAERSGLPFATVRTAADRLLTAGLLAPADDA